ncbi:YCF48-related protein [bacterium]|nr:YCF48-related protein [bacterium]
MRIWTALLIICYAAPSLGQTSHPSIEVERLTPPDTSISFRGIFAKSENEVWLSGTKSALYHSYDGGRHFQKFRIPNSADSDFRDIECFADGSILVMSVGSGTKSKIFKSSDNGKTWNVAFENPHPDGFLNSIAFWDDANGIAVGDPVNGHLYILLTVNGGDTWKEADPKAIPEALENEHSFAASGTCVAVLGRDHAWIGMGGSSARIFRTEDRGKTWHAYVTPLLHGASSAGIFSVFFRDPNHGMVIGGDYTKESLALKTAASTRNGGERWTPVSDRTLPFQSSVNEMFIAGVRYWISTGPTGTHLSKDGEQWTALGDDGYHCLSVSESGKAVWLAGPNGRVGKILGR